MEFDLLPGVPVCTGTFAAVTAPVEKILEGLNRTPEIQKFLFLYVSGNYSRLLTGIGRGSANLEIQRAFTAFQLISILRDAHHTIIFIEHDSSLYDDTPQVTAQVAQAMKAATGTSVVVLYAPRGDASFYRIARSADRVVSCDPVPLPVRDTPRRPATLLRRRRPGTTSQEQATLDGFRWEGVL